ncbi:MAG: hypothetical protein RLN96_08220, partial [Pseudomonadales bacterium]
LDTRALRWQKLWRKFLSVSRLPDNPAWTTSTYEKNLPGEWPDERKVAVKEFLESYARNRFGNEIPSSLQDVEISLKKCSRTLATNN